jgi:hypothetical protein
LRRSWFERQFQVLPGPDREPLLDERGAEGAYALNVRFCERPGSKFVKFIPTQRHPGTPLGVEEADDPLYLNGLIGKRSARAFAGGVVRLPTFRDQAEESAPVTESSLDRIVRQIMQREVRGVSRLLLPGY